MLFNRRGARYEMDMTSGPLLKKVLRFAGPLVLTGVLQLLYNAADMVVVGNFSGHEALAAVGSTSSLINLLVNVFMGLSVGASVQIARQWGAGNGAGVSRGVRTAISVAGISGVAVGILGFTLARPLLELMGNPADVIDLASLYMRIFFLGMPANMLYNFGAAILRAVGDTRRPLIYLTIAGLVNVLLNLLFVIAFRMSVAGVALATVISQAVSMTLVLWCLCHSDGPLHLDLRKLRIDREQLAAIARVGLPAGLQGSLFSVSNVLIQSAINEFGSIAVAGNSVASNLEGFVYTSMNSIYQADLTFASQNFGAHKPDRVKRVMWVCLGTVGVMGLVLGFAFWALGTPLLSIYNRDPEVIRFGLLRLGVIMPTYCLCGMMDTMVGQLRGVGCSVTPMFVSLAGACLFRIVWILTLFAQPAFHSLTVLYLSYPVSWALTFAVHLLCWHIVSPRLLKSISS